MKTEKVYIEYLLLQAQQGQQLALDKLLLIVRQKMMNYAGRLMFGAADAEDCVQEAMLVVLKRLSHVKDAKAFHTWVYKVINSRCHDSWRKQHHDLSLDDLVAKSTEPVLNARSCEGPLFDVKRAVAQLSSLHQSVIYLFYFEGFKVAEMAIILNKPAGTIKSHLFDAREAIKIFLNQE